MLECVGDDGHLEGVGSGIADGEGDPVDGDGTLVDGEVALEGHLPVFGILEGEVGGAVGIVHGDAACCLVDVSLHDVAVEPAVHEHGSLHVDLVAHLQQAEVGAVEGFLHGSDDVVRALDGNDGEAHTIVGDTLVNLQFVDKGACERKIDIPAVFPDGYDGSKFFDDSRKHN